MTRDLSDWWNILRFFQFLWFSWHFILCEFFHYGFLIWDCCYILINVIFLGHFMACISKHPNAMEILENFFKFWWFSIYSNFYELFRYGFLRRWYFDQCGLLWICFYGTFWALISKCFNIQMSKCDLLSRHCSFWHSFPNVWTSKSVSFFYVGDFHVSDCDFILMNFIHLEEFFGSLY